MTAIPFYLVNGFLGSGKTTFLKRVLDQYADDKKIGVIQNEFAALNVDARELRRLNKTFQIMEVNRGSVFCVCLLSDFIVSLRDFIDEHQPEALFLEASGLSDPISILELLSASQLKEQLYLANIWSIVDASTFLLMEKTVAAVPHQVRVADIVVVNKSDLAEAGTTGKISHRIKELNPFAEIHTASYCDVPLDLFSEKTPTVIRKASEFSGSEPQSRPPVGTAVVKSTKKISVANLNAFLQEQAPKAWRLKGHVRIDDGSAVMLQSVFGKSEIAPLDYAGPTEIIAIGPEVDAKEFSRRFRELVN